MSVRSRAVDAIAAARDAADGDSNDEEIEALQDALEILEEIVESGVLDG